ncbi:hypothetical protein LZ198_17585 [Myxococcus sp. K15C18031901]|uniref:DUF7151 family protein n=1 Tax=Myxococcus dinghuensis TaxID=2906761 RepID=UPI0020A6E646|nr:hypothetical protein [Myxococcus dinghuensis]MCP3100685.1 hypothetical protein [Myxococcus dinghuensis]
MRRSCFWLTTLALATAGCDTISLDDFVRRPPALTRIEVEASGGNCEHGGKALLSGLDLDEDGTLSDAEVTRVEYLCTAKPEVVILSSPLAPGGTCPRGGSLLRAGVDLDGDGRLADAEVTREVTTCTPEGVARYRLVPFEGPPGPCATTGTRVEAGLDLDGDGALGATEKQTEAVLCFTEEHVRVRLAPEPLGAQCPAGGTRVDAGIDSDGDGVFEDEEVLARTYVCQPLSTYVGDFFVRDETDLALLQRLSHIQGSLSINQTALTQVVVPSLMMVQGNLILEWNDALTRVELRSLRFVAGDVTVSNSVAMETLVLGSGPLWVEGTVWLYRNLALTSLSGVTGVIPRHSLRVEDNPVLQNSGEFTYLTSLEGDFIFGTNPKLTSLPWSVLRSVGGTVNLSGLHAMKSLPGTQLEQVGGTLAIHANDLLEDLSALSKLTRVHGTLFLGALPRMVSAPNMEALQRTGGLELSDNLALEEVGPSFPVLEAVDGYLRIQSNPRLQRLGRFPVLSNVTWLEFVANLELKDVSGLEGVTELGSLLALGNASLTGFTGLRHVRSIGTLNVQGNPALTSLGLDGLETVRDTFFVRNNTGLPTCLAQALATRVFTAIQLEIEGNDDSATCAAPTLSGGAP